MYICICEAVTDKEIQSLAESGCNSVREISKKTCAGTNCGKCVPQIRKHLSATEISQNEKLISVSNIA